MRPFPFLFALSLHLSFFVPGFWPGQLVIVFVGFAFGLVLLFSILERASAFQQQSGR